MKILLVDDERFAVEVMYRMIDREKLGISEIYKALSMKQAQQICRETELDIIICDIEMPGGSGLDFAQWLAETDRKPVMIFLTSHAVFSYAQQAVALGVSDYLLKPIEKEEMDKALCKAVHKVYDMRKNSLEKKEKMEPGPIEKNLRTIKKYIEVHYPESLTRESLAALVFMNPDYLSRLFKKEYGYTLMDYVLRVRMEKAAELLRCSSQSISEIALETGHSNTAYFTKMFKKYSNGITPKDYRKKWREGKAEKNDTDSDSQSVSKQKRNLGEMHLWNI